MPETAPDLILVIHMNHEHRTYDHHLHGCFNAYVYAAETTPRYEGQPMRHLYAHESPWAQLALSASYGYMPIAEGRYYGFEAGFQPEHALVTAKEIDRIAKGLKKLARHQEQYADANGRPQSLGQDVVCVMQALGIKRACWKRPTESRGFGEYQDWRVATSMEEIRHYIDSTIDACRQQQIETQAA